MAASEGLRVRVTALFEVPALELRASEKRTECTSRNKKDHDDNYQQNVHESDLLASTGLTEVSFFFADLS
jgi:hypothetical protein